MIYPIRCADNYKYDIINCVQFEDNSSSVPMNSKREKCVIVSYTVVELFALTDEASYRVLQLIIKFRMNFNSCFYSYTESRSTKTFIREQ